MSATTESISLKLFMVIVPCQRLRSLLDWWAIMNVIFTNCREKLHSQRMLLSLKMSVHSLDKNQLSSE